ncbi:MAG: hypothetical protein J5518_00170 [Lachnospiraceae bacterium]|nr:hypothetical protein [Lachnospiraceae bacterium]
MKALKTYVDLFKKENIVLKLFTVLLLLFTVYFLVWVMQGFILGLSYPKERYELVNLNLAEAFLNGQNPYLLESLSGDSTHTPVVYLYPFVNSLLAGGLSFLFGGNVLLSLYIVSFLAMILSGLLAFLLVLRYSRTTVGPALAFLLVMFCHWRYGYTSAAPDALGIFVTLLTLYLAVHPTLKHKPLWCSLGIVLTFYIKLYFVGICISIFLYMWFRSKRDALKLFLYCVFFTGVSVALIAVFWPLYWDYTVMTMFYGSNATGTGTQSQTGGIAYFFEQFLYLSRIFAGFYLMIAAAFVWDLIRKKRGGKAERIGDEILLFGIQIPVQLLMLLFFARHDGAYLTYFLQLLFPSLIIYALIRTEQIEIQGHEKIYMACYVALSVFTVYFGFRKLPMHLLNDTEIATWESAYTLMDEYREQGEVLNYYPTAFEGVQNGDTIFATGHDNAAMDDNRQEQWESDPLGQTLFPDAGLLFETFDRYEEDALNKIEEQEYALVTCPVDGEWFVDGELLSSYGYTEVAEYDLQVGNMVYPTEFWGAVQ